MLDKIKQIKYSRLKEEERFFLDTIDGVKPFLSDKYPQSIFWKKNNEVLLEEDYENGWMWINYTLIWSVFETKYGYKYLNTQSLIKETVGKHTNLESLIPEASLIRVIPMIDRHTSLGSLIPSHKFGVTYQQ